MENDITILSQALNAATQAGVFPDTTSVVRVHNALLSLQALVEELVVLKSKTINDEQKQ